VVKARVEAGVCGFVTDIEAYSEDSQHVSFKINTNCEKIGKLSEKIPTVDAYNEIKEGFDGELYKVIRLLFGLCCSCWDIQVNAGSGNACSSYGYKYKNCQSGRSCVITSN
jgi:hypothetical protein